MQKYEFTGHLSPLPPGVKVPLQISGDVYIANDVQEMLRELERWRRVATYLADCQVATAEGALERKSSSKLERKRQVSICESAIRYLNGADPGMFGRAPEVVVERLRRAVGKPAESGKR